MLRVKRAGRLGDNLLSRMKIRLWMVAMAVTGLLASSAVAQNGPDLVDLVVQWASGRYRSPVHCEVDGKLRLGVRRVTLEPEQMPGRPPTLEVKFTDLHADDAVRCVDSKGKSLPNLAGGVELRLPGRPHPETASRDFRQTLKRKKGFDFDIVQGRIKIEPVGLPESPPQLVDFRGGKARIALIYPATDEARELQNFKSQRKFLVSLEAPSGETLQIPIFEPPGR